MITIHRTPKENGNFTQIDNSILRNPKLTIEERGVLCVMLSYKDTWKFTNSEMVKTIGVTEYRLGRILKSLSEKGFLNRELRRGVGGKFTYLTEVFESSRSNFNTQQDNDTTTVKKRNSKTEEKQKKVSTAVSSPVIANETVLEVAPIAATVPTPAVFPDSIPAPDDCFDIPCFESEWCRESFYEEYAEYERSKRAEIQSIARTTDPQAEANGQLGVKNTKINNTKEKNTSLNINTREVNFEISVFGKEILNSSEWQQFVASEKEARKSLGSVRVTALISELEQLQKSGQDVKKVIMNSVKNGWHNFYALRMATATATGKPKSNGGGYTTEGDRNRGVWERTWARLEAARNYRDRMKAQGLTL